MQGVMENYGYLRVYLLMTASAVWLQSLLFASIVSWASTLNCCIHFFPCSFFPASFMRNKLVCAYVYLQAEHIYAAKQSIDTKLSSDFRPPIASFVDGQKYWLIYYYNIIILLRYIYFEQINDDEFQNVKPMYIHLYSPKTIEICELYSYTKINNMLK